MHRFKIAFNNSQHYNNLGNNSPLSRQPTPIASRNIKMTSRHNRWSQRTQHLRVQLSKYRHSNSQTRKLANSHHRLSTTSIRTRQPIHSPMIDRIYKAKPGCSACGKKVV